MSDIDRHTKCRNGIYVGMTLIRITEMYERMKSVGMTDVGLTDVSITCASIVLTISRQYDWQMDGIY